MLGITQLRNWLERKLGQPLKGKIENGFFVATTNNDKNQKLQMSLKRMTLATEAKRFLGIFPVFDAVIAGSLSFGEIMAATIRTGQARLTQELRRVPQRFLALAGKSFETSITERITRSKNTIVGETERLMKGFDEEQLRSFIRTDRNRFRQKLLEELGKKTSELFEESVKKRLAELVLRVRQETAEENAGAGENNSEPTSLPKGTRFHVRKGKMSIFVIEEPPQTRTLKIMDAEGVKSEMYQLSFPHVIFFVTLRGRKSDKMYIFFRNRPLRSVGDELLCAALPNIYEDFHVCFAPSASKDSPAEMAEESIGNFWGGRFIRTHDPSNLTRQISIESWAEGSKKQSLFGLSYNWRPAKLRVARMIEMISQDFAEESVRSREGKKNGRQIMSALDSAVENMTASIANAMKEKSFSLVPSWDIESGDFKKVTDRLKEIVAQIGQSTKTGLAKEVDGIFSEEALKSVLETAAEQTIKSMDVEADRSVETARETFLAQLKGGSQ